VTPGEIVALLDEWIRLAELHQRVGMYINDPQTLQAERWLGEQLPIVEAIAERELGVEFARSFRPGIPGWSTTLLPARELKTVVSRRETIEAIRAEGGPTMAAGGLHPAVWNAARPPWSARLFRLAVADAGTAVDTLLKLRLGRDDLSGDMLITEAFSTKDPVPGAPRLRFTGLGSRDSDRWKGAHVGASNFGRGCVGGLRNWAAHTLGEGDEQVALEYLAALSVLARWIETAVVQHDGDPFPQ
jgi:hypothetical protein